MHSRGSIASTYSCKNLLQLGSYSQWLSIQRSLQWLWSLHSLPYLHFSPPSFAYVQCIFFRGQGFSMHGLIWYLQSSNLHMKTSLPTPSTFLQLKLILNSLSLLVYLLIFFVSFLSLMILGWSFFFDSKNWKRYYCFYYDTLKVWVSKIFFSSYSLAFSSRRVLIYRRASPSFVGSHSVKVFASLLSLPIFSFYSGTTSTFFSTLGSSSWSESTWKADLSGSSWIILASFSVVAAI